jgi:hypothetical protein
MDRAQAPLTCSIIGSFRKHYDIALEAAHAFEHAGIRVRSPRRSTILQPDVHFVRLASDRASASDEEVQLVALHRILASDFVYVVVVDGYVGPTTAYEIGRIVERRRPLFFAARPADLPVPIMDAAVVQADELAATVRERMAVLAQPFKGRVGQLHSDLLDGRLWDEPRLEEAAA